MMYLKNHQQLKQYFAILSLLVEFLLISSASAEKFDSIVKLTFTVSLANFVSPLYETILSYLLFNDPSSTCN
jgi:hypothetical protein